MSRSSLDGDSDVVSQVIFGEVDDQNSIPAWDLMLRRIAKLLEMPLRPEIGRKMARPHTERG